MSDSITEPGIAVRGATHGPLHGVDLHLPLTELICFTGPCGSGVRTMAYDVLYAESRRRYMLALSPLERSGAGGGVARVAVDRIDGLPPAIYFGAGERESGSLAQFLELDAILGRLWHELGEYRCPECGGVCRRFTDEEAADAVLAGFSGTRCLILAPMAWPTMVDADAFLGEMRRAGFLRVRQAGKVIRLDDGAALDPDVGFEVVVDRMTPELQTRGRLIEGIRNARKVAAGRTTFAVVDQDRLLVANRSLTCVDCGRVCQVATPEQLAVGRSQDSVAGRVSVAGLTASVLAMTTLAELGRFCAGLDPENVVLDGVARIVQIAADLRLDDLVLGRGLETLSTGEYGRLQLVRCLASGLSGMLYIFDPPTAGLSNIDAEVQVTGLERLVDLGNTVIAVDHAAPVLRRAGRIVTFAEGRGSTADGIDPDAVARLAVERQRVEAAPEDYLSLTIRSHPVLAPGSTRIPLRRLVALTGTSGAGKTRLLQDVIAPFLGSSKRSAQRVGDSTCSLIGATRIRRVWDLTRHGGSAGGRLQATLAAELGIASGVAELLAATPAARNRNYPPDWFSVEGPGGRCATCEGTGRLRYDMEFLEDLSLTCSACEGRRFRQEVLEVTYRGYSARDMLEITVEQAAETFAREAKLRANIVAAEASGLGQCALGTMLSELEPGQRLRLDLAAVLVRVGAADLVLIDEPAGGAHPDDVETLVGVFDRLVQERATVVVAGQYSWLPDVADWELRLGGDAGEAFAYSGPVRAAG